MRRWVLNYAVADHLLPAARGPAEIMDNAAAGEYQCSIYQNWSQ
jgi:hypothetical protein